MHSGNTFEDVTNFEGWTCGKITTCGMMQFCGGYNVKGSGSDIQKTFDLPAGTYSVELDFIKIDSWCVVGMVWDGGVRVHEGVRVCCKAHGIVMRTTRDLR